MNRRSLLSNVATAFLAQGVSFALSFIQGLIVPKMLGVEQFGYWQLFILYAGYAGIFDLGLNNGVYLIYGGQARDGLDKREVNSQFVCGILYQGALAALLVAITLATNHSPQRTFILICTWIYFVLQNVTWFLCFIFQAINDTKRFSYSAIVERLAFLMPLLLLILTHTASFVPYVIAYLASTICQLGYCAIYSRDILSAGVLPPRDALRLTAASIKVGIALLVANLAGNFILGGARIFIDAAWGIETFGKLSFALSLASFFLAFVEQASMVLFPALRQSTEEQVVRFYCAARDALSLFFPAAYLLYFPIVLVLGIWLPDYIESFSFFILLMPFCVFESKMSVTCTTLFKVRREERQLLRLNLVVMTASVVLSAVGVFTVQSIWFVISGAVTCIVARSLWSECHFNRELIGKSGGGLLVRRLLLRWPLSHRHSFSRPLSLQLFTSVSTACTYG